MLVVEGVDLGSAARLSAGASLVFGTSETCGFVLHDRRLARRHFVAEVLGNEVRVKDLRSETGTWLGGVRVHDVELQGGELIRLGATAIHVERLPDGPTACANYSDRFGSFLGAASAVKRLYPLLHHLASNDVPILIEGEVGVGKSLLARAIHDHGPRGEAPLIVVRCADVRREKLGVLEIQRTRGGTLVLDDVDLLGPEDQARLPQLLTASEAHDVRVIATTRYDLDREVVAGRFSQTALYRLCGTRLELPPLRHRLEDVPLLARACCARLGAAPESLSDEVLARWSRAAWPGNVKELENIVCCSLALWELVGSDASLGEEPAAWLEGLAARGVPMTAVRQFVNTAFERRYVRAALDRSEGNVAAAAAAAGISRRYLQMLKAKFGI